jgi:transposase
MAKQRRRFTAEFKSKVALEALRGEQSIQEIARRYEVHPNQVSSWKRQAQDGLGDIFASGREREQQDQSQQIADLHAKIGELTVERDFLAKRLKR